MESTRVASRCNKNNWATFTGGFFVGGQAGSARNCVTFLWPYIQYHDLVGVFRGRGLGRDPGYAVLQRYPDGGAILQTISFIYPGIRKLAKRYLARIGLQDMNIKLVAVTCQATPFCGRR